MLTKYLLAGRTADAQFYGAVTSSAQIEIIDTRSRRLCTVKFKFVAYELLIVTVYLRYENDASQTDDLREQLFLIELIINLNPNWSHCTMW
jgi:hypothetical protein